MFLQVLGWSDCLGLLNWLARLQHLKWKWVFAVGADRCCVERSLADVGEVRQTAPHAPQ